MFEEPSDNQSTLDQGSGWIIKDRSLWASEGDYLSQSEVVFLGIDYKLHLCGKEMFEEH